MTQWYLKFKSEENAVVVLFRALVNHKINISFIRTDKDYFSSRQKIVDIAKANNIPVKYEENKMIQLGITGHVDFDYGICYSSLYPDGTRNTTISIIGADKGLSQEKLKEVKIIGEALNPSEFEVICEESGPEPVYKGPWNFQMFKKEILPKIKFEKDDTPRTEVRGISH